MQRWALAMFFALLRSHNESNSEQGGNNIEEKGWVDAYTVGEG